MKVANTYFDHISLRLPGDESQSHHPDDHRENEKDFLFFTMDLSYFSGKLEMYFRYKEISFERIEPTAREFNEILFPNTGTEQVPQVYDKRPHIAADRRWLRDTTPIIEYLEQDEKIGGRPVLPPCPIQTFFQRLMEDFADEYLWRPAMFWRWEPSFDRLVMGHRFVYEFAKRAQIRLCFFPVWSRPFFLSLRQWLQSSYGEGCDTQAKKDVIKDQYYELLDTLEAILSEQPFLFGNHPTLVDFGFAGPFFRHFSSDFTPRKVMQQRAPAVYEWVARLWNCKGNKLGDDTGFVEQGSLPTNWHALLKLLPDYLKYYHLNAVAYENGKHEFLWENKSQVFRVPVVAYRAWCRMKIQQHFLALQPLERAKVEQILREHGCWELLFAGGVIKVAPELGTEPPFSLYPPPKHRPIHDYKWGVVPIFARYLGNVAITGAGVGAIMSLAAIITAKSLLRT